MSINKAGFLPNGNGPAGATFGRDPVTGRAYKRDGTVRAERQTRSVVEKLQDAADAQRRALGSMGRAVLAATPLKAGASTMRRYVREANAYGSPERVEAQRARLSRLLAAVDGKAAAARAFLRQHGTLAQDLAEVYAKVGAAALKSPDKAESDPAGLVADAIGAAGAALLAKGNDPSLDPFAAFRRDAMEAQPDEDEDEDGATDAQ